MKYKYLLTLLTIFLLSGCSQQQTDSFVPTSQTENAHETTSEINTEYIDTEYINSEYIDTEYADTEETSNTSQINAAEKEIEVLNLINDERQQNGLCPLEWDSTLYNTAKIRAEEASHVWSHTRPDGTHWSVLSSELHGENLAKGYYEADETFDAWMASEGHKANILRSEFTRGAVSFYEAENGWFWCLHFGY